MKAKAISRGKRFREFRGFHHIAYVRQATTFLGELMGLRHDQRDVRTTGSGCKIKMEMLTAPFERSGNESLWIAAMFFYANMEQSKCLKPLNSESIAPRISVADEAHVDFSSSRIPGMIPHSVPDKFKVWDQVPPDNIKLGGWTVKPESKLGISAQIFVSNSWHN